MSAIACSGTRPLCRTAGFAIIELAIALFIVALLLGAVLVPLQSQVETRRFDETQRTLDVAREALLGYAAAYGYLPCPADAASNGQEPSVGVDHITGACPSYFGFLPGALLSLAPVDAQGYALDAWSNRIRYAVSNEPVAGIAAPFTRSGGMSAATIPSVGAAANLLHVCGSGTGVIAGTSCGAATTLATRAVIVVWSLGPNAATGGGTSADEAQNMNSDRLFVSRVRSTASGNEFDDVVSWVPSAIIISRLVAAGQLP